MLKREDIIRMAREAGFEQLAPDIEDWVCFTEEIERFAALVAAAEREACAKVCEASAYCDDGDYWKQRCAAAIRARGKK